MDRYNSVDVVWGLSVSNHANLSAPIKNHSDSFNFEFCVLFHSLFSYFWTKSTFCQQFGDWTIESNYSYSNVFSCYLNWSVFFSSMSKRLFWFRFGVDLLDFLLEIIKTFIFDDLRLLSIIYQFQEAHRDTFWYQIEYSAKFIWIFSSPVTLISCQWYRIRDIRQKVFT